MFTWLWYYSPKYLYSTDFKQDEGAEEGVIYEKQEKDRKGKMHNISTLEKETNVEKEKEDNHGFEYEVYASRHRKSNLVATIQDKCYVLTYSEYCRQVYQL